MEVPWVAENQTKTKTKTPKVSENGEGESRKFGVGELAMESVWEDDMFVEVVVPRTLWLWLLYLYEKSFSQPRLGMQHVGHVILECMGRIDLS